MPDLAPTSAAPDSAAAFVSPGSRSTVARAIVLAVGLSVVFGVFGVVLLVPVATADAFGPLANGAVADQLPEPWRSIVAENREAWDAGANLPELTNTNDVPSWLRVAYDGFERQDDFVRPTADLHSPALALDLLQRAETREEAIFALGYLSNIAGDIILHNVYLPALLARHGGSMTTRGNSRWVVEAMLETVLAVDYRAATLQRMRKRSIDVFHHWYRVATKHHGERIRIEDFMSDVGLHELSLEIKINATAPGGALSRAVRGLGGLFSGGSELYAAGNYRDAGRYLALVAAATIDIAVRGYDSNWLAGAWGRDNNHPSDAAAMHYPLREGQLDRMPEFMSSPNPGVVVIDSFVATPDGARADHVPAAACMATDDEGQPVLRPCHGVLRIAAERPLDTRLALAVRKHRQPGRDPEVARVIVPLQFSRDDVAAGVVREYRVPFTFHPERDGPFVERQSGFTLGFYLVARVPLLADGLDNAAGGDREPTWLTFFSTYSMPAQELGGWGTYNRWPYSLRVTATANRAMRSRGNDAPPGRLSRTKPAGFAYRFPYALLSPDSTEVRLRTEDGRELVGSLQAACGARRAVVLLHDRRGSRYDFREFQLKLRDAGITSVAFDFRGKNLSGTLADRQAWANDDPALRAALPKDVDAALAALIATGVPRDRVVLIGAGLGATVALKVAAADSRVPAVVALSPEPADAAGLSAEQLQVLATRPLFLSCAARDDRDVAALDALVTGLGDDGRPAVVRVDLDRLRGHGAKGLARNAELPASVIEFVTRHTE